MQWHTHSRMPTWKDTHQQQPKLPTFVSSGANFSPRVSKIWVRSAKHWKTENINRKYSHLGRRWTHFHPCQNTGKLPWHQSRYHHPEPPCKNTTFSTHHNWTSYLLENQTIEADLSVSVLVNLTYQILVRIKIKSITSDTNFGIRCVFLYKHEPIIYLSYLKWYIKGVPKKYTNLQL